MAAELFGRQADLHRQSGAGSRLSVVVRGRLRQEDVPQQVLTAPVDPEVAAFVGVETRLPGRLLSVRKGLGTVEIQGHRIEAVTSLAPLAPPRNVLCCLRPEDVTLRAVDRSSSASPVTTARNRLNGFVVSLMAKGPSVHVTVDCGTPIVAAVTKLSVSEIGLRPGDTVEASFKATAVHLIGLPD